MGHICFCHKDIGDIDRGGVCVLFKTLMSGLLERGWAVSCVTQRDFNPKGIRVVRAPQLRNYLEYSDAVSHELSRLNPDIVECSNWRVELIDFSRNRGTSKAKVVVRSDPAPGTLFGDTRFFEAEKELYRKADKVLAVSEFARGNIKEKYHADAEVVYNAVDELSLLSFAPGELLSSGNFYKGTQQIFPEKVSSLVQDGKLNIFWCGKTTAMKGFDYLEQIVLGAPTAFSFIVNLGNSPREIRWSPKAADKVVFVNELERSDQLAIWKQCDVFLSTSRAEGFGLALLEGLLLGLPAVGNTNCAVYHEFLPNKKLFLIDMTNTDSVLSFLWRLFEEHKSGKAVKVPDLDNLRFTKRRLISESERVYRDLLGL